MQARVCNQQLANMRVHDGPIKSLLVPKVVAVLKGCERARAQKLLERHCNNRRRGHAGRYLCDGAAGVVARLAGVMSLCATSDTAVPLSAPG